MKEYLKIYYNLYSSDEIFIKKESLDKFKILKIYPFKKDVCNSTRLKMNIYFYFDAKTFCNVWNKRFNKRDNKEPLFIESDKIFATWLSIFLIIRKLFLPLCLPFLILYVIFRALFETNRFVCSTLKEITTYPNRIKNSNSICQEGQLSIAESNDFQGNLSLIGEKQYESNK